jgi:EAL domain-containing protein (putative c-di-GMP-specific phosphodiesterase class I)
LSCLKRFPIDTLKIDRSFVRDLATNADDVSVISAVIGWGTVCICGLWQKGGNTRTARISSGAELSVRQGYYFSHPVIAGEFAQLLERSVAETAVA